MQEWVQVWEIFNMESTRLEIYITFSSFCPQQRQFHCVISLLKDKWRYAWLDHMDKESKWVERNKNTLIYFSWLFSLVKLAVVNINTDKAILHESQSLGLLHFTTWMENWSNYFRLFLLLWPDQVNRDWNQFFITIL